MEQLDNGIARLCDGDIVVWSEQSSSICLKAITPVGDPVELSSDEARDLANELLRLADLVE